MEGSAAVITGQVSVSISNGTVTLYAVENGNWFSIGTVELDTNGRYTFSWNPPLWGQYHVKATWSGDDEYAGADSGIASVYVVPKFLVFAGGGIVIVAIIAVVVFLMHRATCPHEIQTLEETST